MKQKAIHLYAKHRFISGIIAIVVFFVFGSAGLVLVNGETLEPNDSHIVVLYADGKTYDVPSRSNTVGEFLKRAQVSLGESDIVEPAKETKIEVDLFRIRVSRARPYVLRDGTTQVAALSAHSTPRLIAESAGITLKPADKVDFLPAEFGDSAGIGRVIAITRSKQVSVNLYGSVQSVNTNVNTVGELLSELNIVPATDDELSPDSASTISDGSSVYIGRKGIKVVTEEVAIPQETEYVSDNDLTLGSTSIRDPGKVGKRVVTYQLATENGAEVSRVEISSVVIEQPIKKVVARGRAAGQIGAERQELMIAAGITPAEYGAVDYIIGQESGWCATKWQGQWGQCPSFYEEKFSGAESSSSLGYGLCQSTPANKMQLFGADWRTNPVTQIKWCYDYMLKYGSATAAADFKQCIGECYSPRTRTTVFKKTTWF